MIAILLILIFGLYLSFFYPLNKPKSSVLDPKHSVQVKKLWSIAKDSMKERKVLRAEKALLAILRFDEKNAAAYNRLGILYAKEQKYNEAIECFEIAQSLDSNASSLHNVGLIYLETGAYEQAVMAFTQALALEGDLPARYIALAKAQELLGQRKLAIEALESAYELDCSTSTLRQILALHEAAGDEAAILATTARIEEQLAKDLKHKEELRAARAAKRSPLSRAASATIKRATATSSRTSTTTTSAPPTKTRRIFYPRSNAKITGKNQQVSLKPSFTVRSTKTTVQNQPSTARSATGTMKRRKLIQ